MACRKFMADHDGMDEVTYRVSVRETQLDDAFEDEAIKVGDEVTVVLSDAAPLPAIVLEIEVVHTSDFLVTYGHPAITHTHTVKLARSGMICRILNDDNIWKD